MNKQVKQINSQLSAIQRRIDFDLLNRSLPGVLVYPIFWPLIFWSTNFHVEHPSITWGLTFVIVSISCLRLLHYYTSRSFYFISRNKWFFIFSSLALVQACVWSLILFLSINHQDFLSIRFMVVLVIGGISSASLHALIPKFWIAATNICIILLPAIFSLAWLQQDYSVTLLLLVYLVYLFITGKRLNQEYIRNYQVEMQLESNKMEIQRQSQIDPLTGIYNRGYFNTRFEFQWNMAIRNKIQQSLLMIDIDYFKKVNDEHGHLVGDQCLIYIASVILKNIKRKTDLVARFGGEEFVILLSDTSLDEAYPIAQEIRKKIENQPFIHDELSLNIKVSIGVASTLPESGNKGVELIGMADQALYKAKEEGRNCVRRFGC